MTAARHACGTPAAYRHHLKNDEPTCQPCRDAWRARQLAYDRARGEARGEIRAPRKRAPAADPRELMPCGTPAAARRHYRRRKAALERGETPEPVCQACLQAMRLNNADRYGRLGDPQDAWVRSIDRREKRNGLPEPVPYLYGIPRPASSLAALGRAAAIYGWPDDEEEAS